MYPSCTNSGEEIRPSISLLYPKVALVKINKAHMMFLLRSLSAGLVKTLFIFLNGVLSIIVLTFWIQEGDCVP